MGAARASGRAQGDRHRRICRAGEGLLRRRRGEVRQRGAGRRSPGQPYLLMAAVDVAGEFETIRRLLAPIAHPEWARGLADDVAVLPGRPGHDLVLTKDTIVEGVHFLPEDPLDTVARKLLRVNLSDLAAKGAEPFGYLLSC